jgi:Flp pilus assembly protein TadD
LSVKARWAGLVAVIAVMVVAVVAWWIWPVDPARLRAVAEAASRAGRWPEARDAWRAVNASGRATPASRLAEAKACLALGMASQAEEALRQAVAEGAAAGSPADPEPWRLLLEIYRVEDRLLDASKAAWEAYDRIAPVDRPAILRELTLASLSELPDELVRTALNRWMSADPDDIDAEVALLNRMAAEPRSGDPRRSERQARLGRLLEAHPDHANARAALVASLADAGEPDRGREILHGWPGAESDRDARYWRLRGRWLLEYDHQPELAVAAFDRVLAEQPNDWRTQFRRARALQQVGRSDEARQAAEAVSRIREVLDPLSLGPRLDAALEHLDDPAACRALADLCRRAGLSKLADAWLDVARNPVVRSVDAPEPAAPPIPLPSASGSRLPSSIP